MKTGATIRRRRSANAPAVATEDSVGQTLPIPVLPAQPLKRTAADAVPLEDISAALRALPHGTVDDSTRRLDITPAAQASLAPMIAALRWAAVAFGMIFSTKSALQGDVGAVIGLAIVVFITSWRSILPLRLGSRKFEDRLVIFTDVALLGGAVGYSSGPRGALNLCVFVAVAVAALGWGYVHRRGIGRRGLRRHDPRRAHRRQHRPRLDRVVRLVRPGAGRVGHPRWVRAHAADQRRAPTTRRGRTARHADRDQRPADPPELGGADAAGLAQPARGDRQHPRRAAPAVPARRDLPLRVRRDQRGVGPEAGRGMCAPPDERHEGAAARVGGRRRRDAPVAAHQPGGARRRRHQLGLGLGHVRRAPWRAAASSACSDSSTPSPTTSTSGTAASSGGLADVLALTLDNARRFGRLRSLGAEEERTRIARDLHDRLGQWLTYISFELERIIVNGSQDAPQLSRLYQDVQRALEELRETLRQLRSEVTIGRPLSMVGKELIDRFTERTDDRGRLARERPG